MSYRVNGKNFAVGRLMLRGKDAEKRLKYLHVSPKGTAVVSGPMIARVSLPVDAGNTETLARIVPQEEYDKLDRPGPEEDRLIELPAGEPAVTGPHFLVPTIEKTIPEPTDIDVSFTCNGDLLRKLLTAACEVCEDSDSTLRVRISKSQNAMRIDTYRQPGRQEFVGVLKGIDYDGDFIPGEVPSGVVKPEKKPQQSGLALKASTGRRFRGDGE
jgi:hypothetical protein